jgi:AAA15 family ATPase/GTPase
MALQVDFTKLRTSWTKFDIVQVLDVVYSLETIEKYKRKEAKIDEPILRSFLGVKSLSDPTPSYWIEIQKYPVEKRIFSLLVLLFTHEGVIRDFATKYSDGNMKGTFIIDESNKQLTNIRSALVEAGATDPTYRRETKVPFDFSVAFYNLEVGKLFKQALKERISGLANQTLTDEDFYKVCNENLFYRALSLSEIQFKEWLEGKTYDASYISRLEVNNFFSITDPVDLDFEESKEIYFLGENGDGKSLLLMSLYLAFNGNYIRTKTEQKETGRASDILQKNLSMQGYDEVGHEYNIKNAIYLDKLFAYGTHRGRPSADDPERYGFMSLFDNDQKMTDPVQWLKDLKLDDNNTSEMASNNLHEIFFNLLERNVKTVIEGSEVYFEEKGYKLTLEQLSEGYRSILIFVCDLLARLSAQEKFDISVLKKKAVVLVDEVDQHLHPRWQRIIVKKLREIFPNIQFFFTTHSPVIIQGASEDAIIYRVYREEGITKVSDPYYRKDLDHLMMNTLLTSSLFGLDDSRLDPNNGDSVTDDSYLLYKIDNKLKSILAEERTKSKNFPTDQEIDTLIETILKEERSNEKNK